MNFLKPKYYIFNLIFLFVIWSSACKQTTIPLAYGTSIQDSLAINQVGDFPLNSSFLSIHQNILIPRCALPPCHAGPFEPDFRTIFSSYSTLVFHEVIKNDSQNSYQYRVVPFDTAASVLFQRLTNCCFVNEDDRMPQSYIGESLPNNEIMAIADWILEGAKDAFGKTPQMANHPPIIGHTFRLTIQNSKEDLTSPQKRNGFEEYGAILLKKNQDLRFGFGVNDKETSAESLQEAFLEISIDNSTFENAKKYPAYFENKEWVVGLKSSDFPSGKTCFMRFSIKDPVTEMSIQYPSSQSAAFEKGIWSFMISPK